MSVEIAVPASRASQLCHEVASLIISNLRRSGYTIKCDARRGVFTATRKDGS